MKNHMSNSSYLGATTLYEFWLAHQFQTM